MLEHLSAIEDTREPHRVAYPLAELLLLAVCGTIADCDDYEGIAQWGEQHVEFLRRFLPYYHGVPSGRWLTIMMNRINPALFSACFTGWVRACWLERPELVAIDGKTSRRSHDRGAGQAPCIWFRPSPRPAGSFWGRKRSPTNRANSAPFRCCWSAWPRAVG